MVVHTPTTGPVVARNHSPSESDVVHDHIRPSQHEIVAIVGVGIGALRIEHLRPAEGGETVGAVRRAAVSSARVGSAEMISVGCSAANGQVLIKRVGEDLSPSAESRGLWWPGSRYRLKARGNSPSKLVLLSRSRSGLGSRSSRICCVEAQWAGAPRRW